VNIREIPLKPLNQQFSIVLDGQQLNMRIQWRGVAGWILDLMDAAGNPLALGLPMVPGVDLLSQYKYLGINGLLLIDSDSGAEEYPTQDNLGIRSHLYFIQE